MKPTDYLTSDRRGRDAHDLELEAQCDPFVAEALQGLEETPGDHRAAVESLRLRITERAAREARRRRLRRIRQWTAAAAAVLLLVTAGIMTWHRAPVGKLPPAVTLADGTLPPAAGTETAPSSPSPGPKAGPSDPSSRPGTGLSGATVGNDSTTADKQAGEQPATRTRPAGHTSAGQAATDGRTQLRTHRDPQQQDLPDDTDAYPEHPAPDALSTDESNHIVVTGYGSVQKAPYTGSAETAGTSNSAMDLTKPGDNPTGLAPDAPTAEEIEHIVVTAYGVGHKAPYTGSAERVETSFLFMDDAEPEAPEKPDGSTTERGAKVTTKVFAEELVWEEGGNRTRPDSDLFEKPGPDGTYLAPQIMPLFREGDIYYKEFRQWVQARVRTPRRLCRDTTWQIMRVITSFVIDSTGRLTRPYILHSPDSQLSRRALRILKKSPRWTPGRQAGKHVPVKFTLPVDFHNPNYRPGESDRKQPAATHPARKRPAATQPAEKQPAEKRPTEEQPERGQR